MIDVFVPVLGRPANAAPLVASLEASGADAQIVFIASSRDVDQVEACEATGCLTVTVPWPAGRADYARKMNRALVFSVAPWVLLGSDDIAFEPGWDTELLRVAERTGKQVIGTNDMSNRLVKRGVFSTHTLVERSYIFRRGGCLEGPGYLVSEAYDHNFVDRELACLAQVRDVWAFAPQAIVRHNHPMTGRAKPDETYAKGRRYFQEDQALFWTRAKEWDYAGLLPQELTIVRRGDKRIKRFVERAKAREAKQ